MNRLGIGFTVLLASGCAFAVLAAASALTGHLGEALASLSGTAFAALAALALHRIDTTRIDTTRADTTREGHGLPGPVGVDLAADFDALRSDLLSECTALVRAHAREQAAESAALLRLISRTPEIAALPLDESGPTLRQVDHVAVVIAGLEPVTGRRVLAVDAGGAADWWAHVLAPSGGSVVHVGRPAGPGGQRLPASDREPGSAEQVVTPETVPGLPHAFLPWHDLTALAGRGGFDVVVVGGASRHRVVGPVLPLVLSQLAPDGILLLLAAPSSPVASAWTAAPTVAPLPGLTGPAVTALAHAPGDEHTGQGRP